MIDVTLFTDGACKGNPGPGGWGVLIILGDQKIEIFGGHPNTTNNRMELLAVINGLKEVKTNSDICVFTDSKYVKNGIENWIDKWIKNGWQTSSKKPVANKDLWIELNDLAKTKVIEWSWVKGHSGNWGNERADYLANKGVKLNSDI